MDEMQASQGSGCRAMPSLLTWLPAGVRLSYLNCRETQGRTKEGVTRTWIRSPRVQHPSMRKDKSTGRSPWAGTPRTPLRVPRRGRLERERDIARNSA